MMKWCACLVWMISAAVHAAEPVTFRNPINPAADPWLGYAGGEYHLTTTAGDRVQLWSAKTIVGLKDAQPVTVWEKGKGVWEVVWLLHQDGWGGRGSPDVCHREHHGQHQGSIR